MAAAAQQLSASEIENVLEGNTIVGTWGGDRYRQYFAEDGTTIYLSDEGKRAQGQWRVDPEQDVYESWWMSTGWTPYALVDVPDDGYAWRNGDRVEPFEVKEGRQIE
ncbi:hypothetical protein [Roseovarius sp. D22-M7]|uniref:hypothetical protein n=1 Tax=Roseovarius sp. D22-M7 TaxID=3127116 RepID=UPI0030104A10